MSPAEILPGNWERMLLPDILALLNESRATGQLSVVSAGATRDLHFVNGELRAARSDHEEERLGSWLVAHHFLTEARKQGILLMQQGDDAPPLGHLLVAKGLIETDPLEEQVEKLALTILQRATLQERREVGFQTGAGTRQPDTLPRKPTQQLVLLAARAIQDPELKRQVLGQLSQMMTRAASPADLGGAFDLTVPESIILDHLDRPRTLNQLRLASGLSADTFFSAAYNLRAVRLIRLAPRRRQEPSRALGVRTATSRDAGHHGSVDPTEVRGILEMVDRLAESGEVYTAVKRLRHLCDIDPQPEFLIKLARLMFLRPQWAGRALEALRRASELAPGNPEPWVAVADYWHTQGDSDRERRALEQALIAQPDHSESTERYLAMVGEERFESFLQKVFQLRRAEPRVGRARIN